jgi:hypothetical protein
LARRHNASVAGRNRYKDDDRTRRLDHRLDGMTPKPLLCALSTGLVGAFLPTCRSACPPMPLSVRRPKGETPCSPLPALPVVLIGELPLGRGAARSPARHGCGRRTPSGASDPSP